MKFPKKKYLLGINGLTKKELVNALLWEANRRFDLANKEFGVCVERNNYRRLIYKYLFDIDDDGVVTCKVCGIKTPKMRIFKHTRTCEIGKALK